MASRSEKTFGNRLAKGLDLLTVINDITVYEPTNNEITRDSFSSFLKSVEQKNSLAAEKKDSLDRKRATRLAEYKGPDNVKNLSSKIRNYVGSMSKGQDSIEFKNIQKLVQKMNNYSPPKKEKMIDKPLNDEEKKKISSSEQSYGSILSTAKDILSIIKNIPGYNPSNEKITLVNFEKKLQYIEQCNKEASIALNDATFAINDRAKIYDDFMNRVQKVKSYIYSIYDRNTAVYKRVSKIRF